MAHVTSSGECSWDPILASFAASPMHPYIKGFKGGTALAGRTLHLQGNPPWSEPMAMRIVHLPWVPCSLASLAARWTAILTFY